MTPKMQIATRIERSYPFTVKVAPVKNEDGVWTCDVLIVPTAKSACSKCGATETTLTGLCHGCGKPLS